LREKQVSFDNSGQTPESDWSSNPIFYDDLAPLSSALHSNYRFRRAEYLPKLGRHNAIPLTIDEFAAAGLDYPILFSEGEDTVPLALMGLAEGVNVYFDLAGRPIHSVYLPAYVRRYPFLLAYLDENAEELSLCYDPTSNLVGEGRGEALFERGAPTLALQTILRFCEDFEEASQRTNALVARLLALGLIVDGEITLTAAGRPYAYRGFQKVDADRLAALDTATRRELESDGSWALINAHLSSLPLLREVSERQRRLGLLR
jgi:hypothetical protein